MKNSTSINHDLRIQMKLSLSEYCVADAISKNPKLSTKKIAENFHFTLDNVDKIVRRLVLMNFLVIDSETNKLVASESWRVIVGKKKDNSTAIVPVSKEKEYNIVHRIKLFVLQINTDYQWRAVDGVQCKYLVGKLKDGFKQKMEREGTDDEILASFRKFIELLPDPWKSSWDVPGLNSGYNRIVSKIKQQPKGNFVASVNAIKKAAELIDDSSFEVKLDY